LVHVAIDESLMVEGVTVYDPTPKPKPNNHVTGTHLRSFKCLQHKVGVDLSGKWGDFGRSARLD
jgi:hypothetical protein